MLNLSPIMGDMRYLFLRGKSYSVRVTIPPSLRHAYIGNAHVIRALDTKNLSIAQHRRHAAVAAIKEQFKRQKEDAAKAVAEQLHDIETKWQTKIRRDKWGMAEEMTAKEKAEYAKDVQRAHALGSQRIAESLGSPRLGTPIDYLEAEFFAARKLTPRTCMHYRKCRRIFAQHLEREGLPQTWESITKPVALAFESWLISQDTHPVTANALIGGMRSRANFLIKQLVISSNPFQGIALKAANIGTEPTRRDWRSNELKLLFTADCDGELYELMSAALLLGARRAEIVGFRAKDYRGGWLHVATAKSRSGIRKIPCPRLLRVILRERVKTLGPDNYLFMRSKPDVALHTRGNAVLLAFNKHRYGLGLNDSATVFHSFRHSYVTLADESRPRHHVRAVVGHSDRQDTTGGYLGRVSDRNMVRVMQAVLKGLPHQVRAAIKARLGKV